MKRLPLGIQTFSKLVQSGFAYVDKTELVYRMLTQSPCCFLSRPRRFGKSLLTTTLAAALKGKRDLFDGLWIASSDYSWTPHTVLHLDFSLLNCTDAAALQESLNLQLIRYARIQGVDVPCSSSPAETLAALIDLLAGRQPVAILIDEYDRPIVKHICHPERARANLEVLQSFFAVIKALEGALSFVFVTGVSRFARVSLFSGMNHLVDHSFDPEFSTVAGLTEGEIKEQFGPWLHTLAQQEQSTLDVIIDRMRHWYNGYLFGIGGESVFNPWSVLQFLSTGRAENYWFSSATPTFAIERIKEKGWAITDLARDVVAGSELLDSYDPDRIELVPLLYQTGYLTLDRYDPGSSTYYLKTPNEEVLRSMVDHLLRGYSLKEGGDLKRLHLDLARCLQDGDLNGFFTHFRALLSSIPYQLHVAQERYYHSLLHTYLLALGFSSSSEVSTHRGRIDLVVNNPQNTLLFEFKINQSADQAIQQMRDRGYASPYLGQGKPVVLVGANFDSKARTLTDWSTATP